MLPYILFTPRAYDGAGEKRWPLMLFLHGAGERGSSLEKLRRYGPPKIVLKEPDFPFVLVSPQCPIGSYWRSAPLLELLDHVTAMSAVDTNQIVVTGVSMGDMVLGSSRQMRLSVLLRSRRSAAAVTGVGAVG